MASFLNLWGAKSHALRVGMFGTGSNCRRSAPGAVSSPESPRSRLGCGNPQISILRGVIPTSRSHAVAGIRGTTRIGRPLNAPGRAVRPAIAPPQSPSPPGYPRKEVKPCDPPPPPCSFCSFWAPPPAPSPCHGLTPRSSNPSQRRFTGSSRRSTCSANPCPKRPRRRSLTRGRLRTSARGAGALQEAARPVLPGRGQHQPREPGEGDAGPGRPPVDAARLAGLPRQGPHEAGHVTAELAADSPNAAPSTSRSTNSRRAQGDRTPVGGHPALDGRRGVPRPPARAESLRSGRRIPAPPDLQPGRRPPRGEASLQVSARVRKIWASAATWTFSLRANRLFPSPWTFWTPTAVRSPPPFSSATSRRTMGLPRAVATPGAGLLLPPANLPGVGRDRALAPRQVHGRVHPRARVPDALESRS